MSTQLLLLLGAVLLAVIAALVWWRRGKLQELPVLSPQAAGSVPDGTEVVITGLAGGESGSSPFTGASGLLFEADEVTEWTEPSSDNKGANRQQRRTRNLGTSGSLTFIEEAGSTIDVRSGSNFDISGFLKPARQANAVYRCHLEATRHLVCRQVTAIPGWRNAL